MKILDMVGQTLALGCDIVFASPTQADFLQTGKVTEIIEEHEYLRIETKNSAGLEYEEVRPANKVVLVNVNMKTEQTNSLFNM